MEKVKMIDLTEQHNPIADKLLDEAQEVILSGKYINGPKVEDFARDLSDYLGKNYVLPCANGTDALHLALLSLDLPKGSEIMVPAFNYVSAVESIVLRGYKPIFVDVDPISYNIDTNDVREKITSNTKAIIIVHLFGASCNMDAVMQIWRDHDLYIIEDTAQALGSETIYTNKEYKTGTVGHIGTTSFFPTKNLGCFGDGGALFTNDKDTYEKAKALASHGQTERYHYDYAGINSRLDAIQAAFLSAKLPLLDQQIEKKRMTASIYFQQLLEVPQVSLPNSDDFGKHSYHQYTIRVSEKRDELKEFLEENGIETMIYYPLPLHKQKAYKDFDTDLPVSEALSHSVLSLPIHPEITHDQIFYVCEKIKEFFSGVN